MQTADIKSPFSLTNTRSNINADTVHSARIKVAAQNEGSFQYYKNNIVIYIRTR